MNNFNDDGAPGGGVSAGKLIAIGVLLTIGILGFIKFFVSGNAENSRNAVPAPQQLFKPETPPGYNPARRAEATASGGSLEQLDAGYLKEELPAAKTKEASGEDEETAPVVKTKARAKKTAQKTKASATTIPRLKTMDSFKSFSDKKKTKAGAQQLPPGGTMPQGGNMPPGMPDLSKMMKGAAPMPGQGGQ